MTAEEFALKLEHKARIKRNAENDRRNQYYLRQKLFGLLFVVFAVVMFSLSRSLPELRIAGFIVFAVGIYVIATKHMMLVDSYFMEMKCKGKLI